MLYLKKYKILDLSYIKNYINNNNYNNIINVLSIVIKYNNSNVYKI